MIRKCDVVDVRCRSGRTDRRDRSIQGTSRRAGDPRREAVAADSGVSSRYYDRQSFDYDT